MEDSSQDYGRLGVGVAAKFTDQISGQVGFDALVGRSDGQEYTINGGISFSF